MWKAVLKDGSQITELDLQSQGKTWKDIDENKISKLILHLGGAKINLDRIGGWKFLQFLNVKGVINDPKIVSQSIGLQKGEFRILIEGSLDGRNFNLKIKEN